MGPVILTSQMKKRRCPSDSKTQVFQSPLKCVPEPLSITCQAVSQVHRHLHPQASDKCDRGSIVTAQPGGQPAADPLSRAPCTTASPAGTSGLPGVQGSVPRGLGSSTHSPTRGHGEGTRLTQCLYCAIHCKYTGAASCDWGWGGVGWSRAWALSDWTPASALLENPTKRLTAPARVVTFYRCSCIISFNTIHYLFLKCQIYFWVSRNQRGNGHRDQGVGCAGH